jgi:16S rRNA (uracil1498-N3)-methyltransferase
MKLRRFKIGPDALQGSTAVIRDPAEIRHIRSVLRLKIGDPVILFDGEGREFPAAIVSIAPGEVCLELRGEPIRRTAESPLRIILGMAVLKSDKFEWLLQKTTELGVSEIVPFHSHRVVPRWDPSGRQSRHFRWEKIVAEAAKQCGRALLPRLHPLCSLEEMLAKEFGGAAKIFLWERETERALQAALGPPSRAVCALIGPEGGFSDEEARQAQEAGFTSVRLGPRILRAETAGIVVTGLLQFLLGDLN